MGMGPACQCYERRKPIGERNWRIMQYRCNHSAFNGYHETYSEWSAIVCNTCYAYWRTKADYVDHVRG